MIRRLLASAHRANDLRSAQRSVRAHRIDDDRPIRKVGIDTHRAGPLVAKSCTSNHREGCSRSWRKRDRRGDCNRRSVKACVDADVIARTRRERPRIADTRKNQRGTAGAGLTESDIFLAGLKSNIRLADRGGLREVPLPQRLCPSTAGSLSAWAPGGHARGGIIRAALGRAVDAEHRIRTAERAGGQMVVDAESLPRRAGDSLRRGAAVGRGPVRAVSAIGPIFTRRPRRPRWTGIAFPCRTPDRYQHQHAAPPHKASYPIEILNVAQNGEAVNCGKIVGGIELGRSDGKKNLIDIITTQK